MNFLIFEQQEGGMDVTDSDLEGVKLYLRSTPYWSRARDLFIATKWKSGMYMNYPCGVIVCATDKVGA